MNNWFGIDTENYGVVQLMEDKNNENILYFIGGESYKSVPFDEIKKIIEEVIQTINKEGIDLREVKVKDWYFDDKISYKWGEDV